MTRWAAEVGPTNSLPEYPRPQLVRQDWLNLNGLWDYAVTSNTATSLPPFDGQILVPFPVESALSGVMQKFDEKSKLWYHRRFTIPQSWRGRHVRLHFGAVDWRTHVWINSRDIGEHQGGYDEFTFDITDALQWTREEDISVVVTDPTEGDQPRGKQSRKPDGAFYTSTSGIWQTVWLEPVPEVCIDELKLTPDLIDDELKIRAAVASLSDKFEIEAVAMDSGKPVGRVMGQSNMSLRLAIPHPHLWSPADPFLYGLQVVLKDHDRIIDTVSSYFGMRAIGLKQDAVGKTRIALNGKFLFQIGAMDQGFWPDGIYTAPTDEALRHDLEFLKRAGFNLVRKHVKVEPQRWYYWCDKLGLLVWQDMPSGNNSTAEGRREFEIELRHMIEGLYNHPAIVQWVLFNEGWGQFDTQRLTARVKSMDPSRLVDSASGWTDKHVGDIVDTHDYASPKATAAKAQRAAVLGEYGGLGFRVSGHCWSDKFWAYRLENNMSDLSRSYIHLLNQVWSLHKTNGISAAVYTQTTDIETECNGLMTYDRAVEKINPSIIRAANAGQLHNDSTNNDIPLEISNRSAPDLSPQ